ncbi:type II toxin-antitoxin system HicA family toxin [Niabella ginsengisoli]|uniref:Type II toxin-antitoxin system HicA family toxin n=1 Tax=Niabella ginsengisoli TaxID=522298 RepID=A0ABS9SMM7_9BACT|nr:type II toxin-antitoxin system HicA family toxin [Niabella ginsengisoli]MCH5599638.1 type II toxin-antitoxin system HicA family toxin [Niabella ginsengisoli]
MKIPRDISGKDLIKLLKPYGYIITRQAGSHIRLTTEKEGQHHITIPHHNPLKLGTPSAILSNIAEHFSKQKEELINELFGKDYFIPTNPLTINPIS